MGCTKPWKLFFVSLHNLTLVVLNLFWQSKRYIDGLVQERCNSPVFSALTHQYLHFLSFLDTEMVLIVEILPCWKQGHVKYNMASTMVADDLAPYMIARSSAAMVLIKLFPKILVSAPIGWILWPLADVTIILNMNISNTSWWLIFWWFPLKLPSCEHHRTWLMIHQNWFS